MRALPGNRWKRPAACVLAGVLASASLPPLGLLPGLLALSLPLHWMAGTDSRRDAAVFGLATGFGWFVVSLSWTSQAFVVSGGWHVFLIPFPAIGLPLVLGAFWAAAFLLASAFLRHPAPRILLAVALLALAEYARGFVFTGFPWNTPGMAFAGMDAGLGAGAWVGPWGLAAVALLLAAIPSLLFRRFWALSAALTASVLFALGLGLHHSGKPLEDNAAAGMTVRLVQPNIPQGEKWLEEKRDGHVDRLVSLSRRPPTGDIDLVVWPESAFAGILERERGALAGAAQAASSGRSHVLTGVLRMEDPDSPDGPLRFFNSMVLVDPGGGIGAQYDKRHLVPFGEYAPFRRFIPFVDAIAGPNDFHPGRSGDALAVPVAGGSPVRMLPLICYEVIFPGEVRRAMAEAGADMIVTITNDAWFGDSIGPRQHLAMARMRAAELGTPVVRVGNNGISAVIDGHGRITHRIDLNEEGVIDARVGGAIGTPYSRHGDRAFWAILAAVVAAGLAIEGLTRKTPKQ